MSDLLALRDAMREFTSERDWERFHDPKSLLLALVGEVGELSELFQWLPADTALQAAAEEPLRSRVGEEVADVLLYLVRLADVLDVDLREAAERKMQLNDRKHPGS
jgi:dCTP diphosphatase